MSNNPPFRTVELTEEQYNFLLNNCDANIAMGLQSLQAMESKDLIVQMVGIIDQFKSVRDTLKRSV